MEKDCDELVRERILDLRKNSDFLMTVFEGLVGYAVIAADFDGNVLACNEGARWIYGYECGDVVGRKNVEAFFPRDFVEGGGLQRLVAELIEKGGVFFEGDNMRKNGERFPAKCLFTLTRSNEGRMIGFVEIAEDLTTLRRAQDELRALNAELERKVAERTVWLEEERERLEASEGRFRALIESASDAVIGIEPPGVIYLWNSKAEAMFGYAASEAVGKDLHETIVPLKYRDDARAGLRSFFETGAGRVVGKTVEIEGMRADGTMFPLELSISAVKARGVWNSLAIVRDITERKRVDEELRRNLDEVERMNRIMVGRELKIVELKRDMVSLKARVKELESAATALNR